MQFPSSQISSVMSPSSAARTQKKALSFKVRSALAHGWKRWSCCPLGEMASFTLSLSTKIHSLSRRHPPSAFSTPGSIQRGCKRTFEKKERKKSLPSWDLQSSGKRQKVNRRGKKQRRLQAVTAGGKAQQRSIDSRGVQGPPFDGKAQEVFTETVRVKRRPGSGGGA